MSSEKLERKKNGFCVFPFFPILCCGFKVDKLKKLNHNRRFDQMALFGLTVIAKTEQNGFVLKIR